MDGADVGGRIGGLIPDLPRRALPGYLTGQDELPLQGFKRNA